jgi:mannose-6-phosphate isomerase-like protein (cupin superfamily)
LLQVRAAGAHTSGRFALVEHTARRGYNAPLHVHTRDDETFIVVDGSLRVVCDGDDYAAQSGAVILLPRGSAHSFVVTSPNARFFTLHHPAGFEDFVVEAGAPAPELVLPPPLSGPPPPEVLEALVATASRYGINIVGPPPDL